MKTLRLSNFGIRGFVGESLTPEVVLDFASAFACSVAGQRVLIGRDTRGSSPMLHAAAVAALTAAGCEVLDYGICPAPLLQFSVPRQRAAGAIAISGGHHPAGWNALLLIGADGGPLEPAASEQVLEAFHAGAFVGRDARSLGECRPCAGYAAPYFDALEQAVRADAIRAERCRIVLDPVGGAGCPFIPEWARRFNVDVLAVNGEPTAYLARDPEPRPRNAMPLAAIVRALGGRAGFVFSSDFGRMSLVTETGEPLSEELTFALLADHVLRRQRGTVVTNCCTTRAVDDIAARCGAPLVKTPVGQAFVVSAVRDEAAVLGGEGSGSAVLPSFSLAFDGFLMMTLVLESLAIEGRPLSVRLRDLPRYEIVKRSVACGPGEGYRALERMREEIEREPPARLDETDGLRLDYDDGWVHVRASRTEPRVRVISEARTRATAEARAERMIRWMALGD